MHHNAAKRSIAADVMLRVRFTTAAIFDGRSAAVTSGSAQSILPSVFRAPIEANFPHRSVARTTLYVMGWRSSTLGRSNLKCGNE
jgi:hypothetical protein